MIQCSVYVCYAIKMLIHGKFSGRETILVRLIWFVVFKKAGYEKYIKERVVSRIT